MASSSGFSSRQNYAYLTRKPQNGRAGRAPPRRAGVALNMRHSHYPVLAQAAQLLHWRVLGHDSAGQGTEHRQGEASSSWLFESVGDSDHGKSDSDSDWDVYWADSGQGIDVVVKRARAYQRINHFPGMVQIYRKNSLARAMTRMQRISGVYSFAPRTWLLPFDLKEVEKFLARGGNKSNRCVIVKPAAGAQGRGIFLAMSPSDLLQREEAVASLGGGRANTIVQSYVTNPLLVDGLKFDLRIYALVVCVNPLRVLVYREGLARFCTSPFQSPTKANLDNTFMHLTNYAVNKHNVNFVQNDKPGPSRIASASGSKVEDVESTTEGNDNQMHEDGASKRSLTWLRSWLAECGVDAEVIWSKIADVVVKTVISIQPSLAQNYRSAKVNAQNQNPFTCFELLGFDIMLTDDLDPVLIEVNHSPSFRTDSPLDLRVKLSLTANTFALLNVSASERLSCCAEATRQSQMRLYGAVFKEKKGQSLSSSESGSRDSISKKSSTTELETASESTGAGVKKSLTGANSGRSFGRGGTAPVANSKKEKKKKGSTKVPVQTSKQYWRRYLENERRCLGDFQLAYPADYYTEQPTAGQQPLYDQLLLRAELAYRLGLTSLTAEDCSSLAKLDVLQPCQKIADPSKFRKYRKDQQQHRRRHGAETTRANDQTSKGDLSSLRHHRDEIFLDSENSEEVNEINLKNGENDWETLSESSDPSRGDQCTDAISPSKFGPSLYSLSQSSSESLTDLVLGYSNQMQNYSWGDEEGSRDWEGGSGGESSPRTEDEIHFESFSEKYRETRQPVEIASWSGNGNLPQLQAKVSTERKIDLGSPTRLHSQRNPSSSTQSWSICSPSKSIANPVDDEAYFTRLGDIRHAPIAPRKPQSAVKTNSPNVASRQIQSVQAEMVNGDSVHFTFLVSDNQQGNVHNCTKQDPFQTIPAQSSPTTRQSESSNHESLAYNVRLNSALNDFLSQEGDADGQSVGSSVCALTGEVFEGSDDTFPAAVMSSVKAAHCSTKGVQDILDERTNDAKTRQLEEYRNFRTSYLQAYRTAKKDAGNLPHL